MAIVQEQGRCSAAAFGERDKRAGSRVICLIIVPYKREFCCEAPVSLVGRDADTVNMNSSYDYKSLRGICVLIPVLGTQNSGTWTRWGG